MSAVANEYAWGTNTIVADNGHGTIDVSSPENGTETNTTDISLGAAVYGNNAIYIGGVSNALGPVRCGLFATANSGRIISGSSYWGIMELSGNLWERSVTVGNSTGRGFTGTHGDGRLDANGDANVPTWPGTGAYGAGFRGGAWNNSTFYLRASDRYNVAYTSSGRGNNHGWRGGGAWRRRGELRKGRRQGKESVVRSQNCHRLPRKVVRTKQGAWRGPSASYAFFRKSNRIS